MVAAALWVDTKLEISSSGVGRLGVESTGGWITELANATRIPNTQATQKNLIRYPLRKSSPPLTSLCCGKLTDDARRVYIDVCKMTGKFYTQLSTAVLGALVFGPSFSAKLFDGKGLHSLLDSGGNAMASACQQNTGLIDV